MIHWCGRFNSFMHDCWLIEAFFGHTNQSTFCFWMKARLSFCSAGRICLQSNLTKWYSFFEFCSSTREKKKFLESWLHFPVRCALGFWTFIFSLLSPLPRAISLVVAKNSLTKITFNSLISFVALNWNSSYSISQRLLNFFLFRSLGALDGISNELKNIIKWKNHIRWLHQY